MSNNSKHFQVGSVVRIETSLCFHIIKYISSELIVIKKLGEPDKPISRTEEISFDTNSEVANTMVLADKEWEEYKFQRTSYAQSVSAIENLLDGVKSGRFVVKEVIQDQEDYFGMLRGYKISFSYSVLEKVK